MDTIQEEAKKQIKDIEGQYKTVFEERMNEVSQFDRKHIIFNAKNFKVREHYETERESIVEKFNEVKEKLAQEREETSSLRIVLQKYQSMAFDTCILRRITFVKSYQEKSAPTTELLVVAFSLLLSSFCSPCLSFLPFLCNKITKVFETKIRRIAHLKGPTMTANVRMQLKHA